MQILITGSNGQLGRDCVQVLEDRHHVVPLDSRALDISDPAAVEAAVLAHRPEVVLNCAAFTQVDACETETDRAYRVNALGPRYLAASLARHGGYLLHISTDYVFDGRKTPPDAYTEDDPPAPLSAYGRTKLAGEQAVRALLPAAAVVRTAWVYGRHGSNFLKKILHLALVTRPPRLRVVHDQYGSPTWSWRLAHQLARLIEVRAGGIYHATAAGYCTWYEFARAFLECLDLDYPLEPCSSAEFPTPAVRPANSILANRRLQALGLDLMPPWQDDLARFVRRFRADLLRDCTAA